MKEIATVSRLFLSCTAHFWTSCLALKRNIGCSLLMRNPSRSAEVSASWSCPMFRAAPSPPLPDALALPLSSLTCSGLLCSIVHQGARPPHPHAEVPLFHLLLIFLNPMPPLRLHCWRLGAHSSFSHPGFFFFQRIIISFHLLPNLATILPKTYSLLNVDLRSDISVNAYKPLSDPQRNPFLSLPLRVCPLDHPVPPRLPNSSSSKS